MSFGFIHSLHSAIQHFFRNWWLSLLTIFMLILSLLSITLIVGLNIVGKELIRSVEEKVNIDFYFYDNTSTEQILATQTFLEKMPEIKNVVYVSREDALNWLKNKHKDDAEFLTSLTEMEENVLPASLIVRAENINSYPDIISSLQVSPYAQYIETTDYTDNQTIITRISSLIKKISRIGAGVSGIFILISVIVIVNLMRLAIYSHREEIGIMKLVGATDWFVRAPFILESIFLGVISAAVTFILFWTIVILASPVLTSFFEGYIFSLRDFLLANIIQFATLEILVAVILSGISSLFAVNRYLKV